MSNDIANAYAFGSLLRDNPVAGVAYDNIPIQQKQSLLLKVASASSEDLQTIIADLEHSAP